MLKRALLFALIVALPLGAPAVAQSKSTEPLTPPPSRFEEAFNAGLTAYDNGDYARAYEIWLPIAKEGDLAAMRNVAHMLRHGRGVERDLETAARWYSAAAKRGLTGAQINLAELFYNGEGVPQSYEMAAQWYARAARAGNASAQFKLAQMIEAGKAEKGKPDLAKSLHRWAMEAGHSGALDRYQALDAKNNPIEHFPDTVIPDDRPEDRIFIPKSIEGPGEPPYTESMPYTATVKAELRRAEASFVSGGRGDAIATWRKLSAAHVPEAQYRLGLALLMGLGTLENRDEALHWLEMAANGGHGPAAVQFKSLTEVPS